MLGSAGDSPVPLGHGASLAGNFEAKSPLISGLKLHQGVLNAMDMARKLLFIRRADAPVGEELQLAASNSVGRHAVATFWSELANFCGLDMVP